MILPGLIAVLSPILVSVFWSTGTWRIACRSIGNWRHAGGAWDNTKNILKKENMEERVRKHIRLLRLVIQSVTASRTPPGSSLNILIKLMTIVALVFAPLFM